LLWIALMFIVKGSERAASAPLPRARGRLQAGSCMAGGRAIQTTVIKL